MSDSTSEGMGPFSDEAIESEAQAHARIRSRLERIRKRADEIIAEQKANTTASPGATAPEPARQRVTDQPFAGPELHWNGKRLESETVYAYVGNTRVEAKLVQYPADIARWASGMAGGYDIELHGVTRWEFMPAHEAKKDEHNAMWARYSELLRKHEAIVEAAQPKGIDAILMPTDDAMEIFRAAVDIHLAVVGAGYETRETIPQIMDLLTDAVVLCRKRLVHNSP